MRSPKISVLMPVYNAADTLGEAVQSILCQRGCEDFELLLLDDGSVDGSLAQMQAIAAQDQRVRVCPLPHRGIAAALNTGLSLARGAYIARMDADDWSYPGRLRLQAAHLDANPELGLVSCLVEFGGDREAQQGYARHVDWINALTSHEAISLQRFVESPIAHPSVMFRRECVESHGAYAEGPFPEDYELWLRWLDAGVLMGKVPQVLLRWNDPPQRLSRVHARYSPAAFTAVKNRYLLRWLAQNNPRHPEIALVGAGRQARRRSDALLEAGIRPLCYIDVKAYAPVQGVPVVQPGDVQVFRDCFIVSVVNRRGLREEIRDWLTELERVEGRDYIFA